ncbi:MAG: hypothetical protein PF485_14960 [Bacteroidales bacterium]|jgi:hypothetical protein|nr:hypothetical protein [Bacteroidales bacterium]
MKKHNILKSGFIFLVLFIGCIGFNNVKAQVKKPVTITSVFTPPYTLYLDEYVTPGSQKCMVNMIFNDYNEPSWDVYLHLTIESQNLRITTKENFRPTAPITLHPGENVSISGDELYDYFNYNNLNFAGITKSEIERSGRLPEGFYTFTFEAKDYRTGASLSDKSMFVANLQLNEPPKIITPNTGQLIPTSETQNIVFQWLTNGLNPGTVKYKLHLFEVLDSVADPQSAIANNRVIKIFESYEINMSTYQYSISDPLLEKGKQYVFYVEALAVDGLETFKNNGLSEVGWFSYGYPQNGKINIIFPEHEHGFTLREDKLFKWSTPNNLTNQQLHNYQMKIVKVSSEEDPKEGIAKDPYHEIVTEPVLFPQIWFEDLENVYFATGQKFAWQVKAFTNETEIAKSDVNTFFGPPFLEFFMAGNHKVLVTKTTTNSFENLSGEGTIQINANGDKHKVYFENIRIERVGAEIFLREGRCISKCEIPKIDLNPYYEDNKKAFFVTDSLLLDRYNLKIKGHVEWDLPHPILSDEKAKVYSKTVSLIYNSYKLIGTVKIKEETFFKLLSPINFNLILNKESYFFIKNDRYKLHFDGKVEFPSNIKGSEEEIMSVPFIDKQQLYFIEMEGQNLENKIRLVKKTKIELGPQHYFIDFSEKESPGKKTGTPGWKGIYFSNYSLNYPIDLDDRNQLNCQKLIKHDINNDDKPDYKAWVNSQGLQFYADYEFKEEDIGYFNTFPSKLKHLLIEIENTTVTDGVFNGAIKIPVIDEVQDFTYFVPLTDDGFLEGYLDEELTGKTFVYNEEGGEQKMIITINRAVFQDKERLDMNIDLDWPFTQVKMEALNHFRIWGNYQIGFVQPKGVASLVVQKEGNINDFLITMDYIGCGREGDLYAIGTSADIIMGEDVAGNGGAPKANLYSISQNALLTGTHGYGSGSEYINELITQSNESNLGEGDFNVGQQNDLENLDSLVNSINQQLLANEEALKEQLASEASSVASSFTSSFTLGETTSLELENGITDEINYELTVDKDPLTVTKEDLLLIIDAIYLFLNDDQKAKVDELKDFINTIPVEYIAEIYEQLRDVEGFVKMILKGKVDEYIARLNTKITDETNKVKNSVITYIENKRDSITVELTKPVGRIIDSIGVMAAEAASGISEEINFEAVVISVTNSFKQSVIDEITESINKSVKDNLTEPITSFIDTSVNKKVTGYIYESLSSVGYALIDDQSMDGVNIDGIFDNASDLIPEIAGDFQTTFIGDNGELILERVVDLLEESITNFDWEDVGRDMAEDLLIEAGIALAEHYITEEVTEIVGDVLDDLASSELISNIGDNIDLDFSNVGDKLKDGKVGEIVKFDPSYIEVTTSVAVFQGFVNFTDDDPIWGDSWQAEIIATITIEPTFTVNAKYINGTSSYNSDEEYKYWFLELGISGLGIPMATLPLIFDGASGRVYHHMSKTEPGSTEYLPDVKTRFGVGLQVDLFDASSNGKVLMFNVGLEVAILQEGFIFEMYGNAWVANKLEDGKVTEAVVIASGYLMFNTAEKHFLANLTALIEVKPLICAGGEMNVDISKGAWRVAIGTREEPFYLDLFCMGSPFIQSWFDIDQDRLDAGLIVTIDIKAETPWIGPSICQVKGWAKIYFQMGTTAIIYWNPFAIGEARVWIDLYVGVGVDSKCISSKSFTIAAIAIGGELMFQTIPETRLQGSAYGRVTLLGMTIGFDLEVDSTF